MKDKLVVGRTVYLKPINNMERRTKTIKEMNIKKIGRKYFEVWERDNNWTVEKFSIDNIDHVSSNIPEWKLYFSQQDIFDDEEKNKLNSEIRESFSHYKNIKLSLDQLRRIKNIIDETN